MQAIYIERIAAVIQKRGVIINEMRRLCAFSRSRRDLVIQHFDTVIRPGIIRIGRSGRNCADNRDDFGNDHLIQHPFNHVNRIIIAAMVDHVIRADHQQRNINVRNHVQQALISFGRNFARHAFIQDNRIISGSAKLLLKYRRIAARVRAAPIRNTIADGGNHNGYRRICRRGNV